MATDRPDAAEELVSDIWNLIDRDGDMDRTAALSLVREYGARVLTEAAENGRLLEIARKAVEDALVTLRDARISLLGRNNGLVIRERHGGESAVIRMGPEDAVRIGLLAIAERRVP